MSQRTKPGDPMTLKQARVYRLILESYRDRGRAPTLRELSDAAGFSSHVGPCAHLRALAARGVILYEMHGKAREIEVPTLRDAIQAAAGLLLTLESERSK